MKCLLLLRNTSQNGRGANVYSIPMAARAVSFALLSTLALLLLSALSLRAQTATGSVKGAITDAAGGAIPGVAVTATRSGSGVVRGATSGETGEYLLPALPAGTYALRFERDGFGPVSIAEFNVPLGRTVVYPVQMKPADLVQKLEVQEQADALGSTATAASAALGNERIEETPAPNRNYLNFVLVAPGATPASGSGPRQTSAAQRRPASDSGFTFGGMRARNNSISIDGVDNRDETTGGNRVAVGLEMVEEFRVSGTSIGAEFGGAAGGAVNMVTRSGANLYHGDATFFAQNELFNARNPEAEVRYKPVYRREQPGVSLLGPIVKDRTFFAAAVEQEFERSEESTEIPDRFLGAINKRLREKPWLGVAAISDSLVPASARQTQATFKLNHQSGSRNSLSARYAFSLGSVKNDVQDVDDFADRSARGSSLTHDHSFVFDWTRVISPSAVNELRGQIGRRSVGIRPNAYGPMAEIPGVLTLGQSYRLDADRTEDHHEIVEALHLTRGAHQISLGASAHTVLFDGRLANRFGGLYVFPTLNDFLADRYDFTIRAFGDPRTRFRTTPMGLWLQDRWTIAPGVTAELGLRYDRQTMPAPIAATNRNIAPRIGLAWHPGAASPWVFRAGAGLFFDRYPLAFLNDGLQKNGVTADEIYSAGSGFAAASVYRFDSKFPSTYSRKFTAGVERSLDKDTTLTAEYSQVSGFHLPRTRNSAPRLTPMYLLEQTAKSSYNGASFTLHRRLKKELTYLGTYHYSGTHDDGSDFDEQPMNPLNTRLDWGRSRQYQKHRLSVSALFELPDEWPKWTDNITFAPIFTIGSARTLNPLLTSDAFRTAAFPLTARPAGFARNSFDSPGSRSVDFRVMKGFKFESKHAILQTGIEAFNLLNHTNPGRVSPYYSANGAKLDSFGTIVDALNGRQVQFMIQYEF